MRVKILIFDSDATVREVFGKGLSQHELVFVDGPVQQDSLKAHSDAEMVSVFVSSRLTRDDMELLPGLRAVIARSSGIDHIDTSYLKEKSIALYSVPRYGAHTVAEYALALILSLIRRVPQTIERTLRGAFEKLPEFEGVDLYGKTLGIIGTGAIGANVAVRAKAFGMQVLLYDLYPNTALESDGAKYVSLNELYAGSDVITLHAPGTPETLHLMNAAAFAQMKDGVIIVNTARGELIETEALLAALRSGKVSRAALDVLEGERDLWKGAANETVQALMNEFVYTSNRVLYTPHIAFFTCEAYHEILMTSVKNALEYFAQAQGSIEPASIKMAS